MDPFGPEAYVPIVLAKRGERGALIELADHTRQRLRPLIVVPPIDWDYDSAAPRKDIHSHIAEFPKALAASWGSSPAFIDLVHLDDRPVASGRHALEWVTDQAGQLGLPLVPVVAPDRTAAYVAAAAAVIARDGNGVCVRLPIPDWPGASGPMRLDRLLNALSQSPRDAHLVLDLGADTGAAAYNLAASELRMLPYLSEWRSVTIAGTAMPQMMPAGQGVHELTRNEWLVYRALRGVSPSLERIPSFGDYVISHVNPVVAVDPKLMSISATLRYTSGDNWLIAKGAAFKASGGRSQGGAATAPALQRLVRHPGYLGSGHCAAEAWMQQVLMGGSGGNPEVWRREGTVHHLQVVTEQVASLGAP